MVEFFWLRSTGFYGKGQGFESLLALPKTKTTALEPLVHGPAAEGELTRLVTYLPNTNLQS